MDPISISHLVQDRTDELQRTADQVRRESSLRSKLGAAAVPSAQPARPVEAVGRVAPASVQPTEARPSPGKAAGCTSAQHAA
jgi:hypothetical protein